MNNRRNKSQPPRFWLKLMLPLLWVFAGQALASDVVLQDFTPGSMANIEQKYERQAYVVALWSVTCPPCLKELELLGQWRREHPDVPLVLISTDADLAQDELRALLDDADLAQADNWVYADSHAEKLRFEIDPNWYGELPRSYFYQASGERHGVSGALKYDQLEAWRNQEFAGR